MRHYDILFTSFQEGVEYYKRIGFHLTEDKRLVRYDKEAVIKKHDGQYYGFVRTHISPSDET